MISVYKADPKSSTAHFLLNNTVIPDVEGHFSSLSGKFNYDPEDLSKSSIEAYIDVNSITTGSESIDGQLKGEDFFNILEFPIIKFISKKFEVHDEDVLKVRGDLTVKSITREVILNVERPDNNRSKKLQIAASTLVNRDEFKLELGSVLEAGEVFVADNIQITMDIQLLKE